MTARSNYRKLRSPWTLGVGLSLCFALATSGALAGKNDSNPGYVDGASFIEIAGDDAVSVEINIPRSLIMAVSRADADLHELVRGLNSIQAIILDLKSSHDSDSGALDPGLTKKLKGEIRKIESGLISTGWERLARIREADGEVKVLVLNDEELIHGMVVMVIDSEEGQMIFANIAGTLDLAALQMIGEKFGVPGLEGLEVD